MPGDRDPAGRAGSRWWWRGVAVAGLVVLAVSVTLGLVWFFSDPRPGSQVWLETLSWRAGVVGMFAGIVVGVAALVVSVLALRAQKRADGRPAPESGASENSPQPPGAATTGDEPGGRAGGPRRSYGGDHIEISGGTFHGPVIGKQVNPSSPKSPAAGTRKEQP